MSDMHEMAERIAAEEARATGGPKSQATKYRIFETTIRYAGVYKPNVGDRYFVSFPAPDLPVDLLPFCGKIRPDSRKDSMPLATAMSNFAPMVVCPVGSVYSLETILAHARASNINPDSLLLKLKVKIAVEPIEYDRRVYALRRFSPQHMMELRPIAIEVNVQAMIDRYDELCREVWL